MSENLESLRRHIRSVLEVYNPWWRDSRWYERDALIQEYQQGDIRVISRLYHHIASKITSPGKYGIATVRGPRRSGKTTMVKLIIYKLISEKGVNPINIYYISP